MNQTRKCDGTDHASADGGDRQSGWWLHRRVTNRYPAGRRERSAGSIPDPNVARHALWREIQFLGHRSPGLRAGIAACRSQPRRSDQQRAGIRRRTTPRRTLQNPRPPSPAKQCRLQPPIPSHGAVRNVPIQRLSAAGNLSLVVPPPPQVVAIYRPLLTAGTRRPSHEKQ